LAFITGPTIIRTLNTSISNKIAPQIQRGFPVDIVRITNLLTYLLTYKNDQTVESIWQPATDLVVCARSDVLGDSRQLAACVHSETTTHRASLD